jgi:hypothetical protein
LIVQVLKRLEGDADGVEHFHGPGDVFAALAVRRGEPSNDEEAKPAPYSIFAPVDLLSCEVGLSTRKSIISSISMSLRIWPLRCPSISTGAVASTATWWTRGLCTDSEC